MPTYQTPGVYIKEIESVPSQIAQVETAIPAFVGYTERAEYGGKDLTYRAYKISSFAEFETYFGSLPIELFDWTDATDDEAFSVNIASQDHYLKQTSPRYLLYKSVKLFYQNGGNACYIVSVGNYTQAIEQEKILLGLKHLNKVPEPTLLVVPEACVLNEQEYAEVRNAMIKHCEDVGNRFSILDVPEGLTVEESAERFRQHLGNSDANSYAAAYMPYLNTVIVGTKGISLSNFAPSSRKYLAKLLLNTTFSTIPELTDIISAMANPKKSKFKDDDIHKLLNASSSVYRYLLSAIKEVVNVVPPSGAVAGAIVQTDLTRGVWKAPANVSLNSVVSPTLTIDEHQQADMNSPLDGKSINAIRSFVGRGTLIWGARTLDSNSADFRYINVKRTLIMIKQSIELAIRTYVFEPNDANTWSTIRTAIVNFLTQLWRQGALAGTTPDHAFSVSIGLNETMTPQDITDGILRLSVLVAMTHPAEFISISITQQMQTA